MTREEREAAVDWFCERMKQKMRLPKNEAKGGWRGDRLDALQVRLDEEVAELHRELERQMTPWNGGPVDWSAILGECIDVAACAMIIADRLCRPGHNVPQQPGDESCAGKQD